MAPSRRRLLGVRHPVSGLLGVYLFLPFGLGPHPGCNDAREKALFKFARSRFLRLRVVDFVGDRRLVETGGGHDALSAEKTGAKSLLGDMGAKYNTTEGEGLWLTRPISRLGFELDTHLGAAKLGSVGCRRACFWGGGIFGALPG